jgi:hypothetical protein
MMTTLPFFSRFETPNDIQAVRAVIKHIAIDRNGPGVEFNSATRFIVARAHEVGGVSMPESNRRAPAEGVDGARARPRL